MPPAEQTIRIAMWSGPRNISTALMRAWENRPDTAVWDEPLYACYLRRTGIAHPMAAEIVAAYETDWRRLAGRLAGPAPGGAPVFYQKHMTHHLLPEIGRGWFAAVRHGFLIRAPEEVLASYAAKRESVTLEDLGFLQQAALFEEIADRSGAAPPVFDAADILAAPEPALRAMCRAFGLPFDAGMLAWPAGPRRSDGSWARHWYAAVEASTGWQPPRPARDPLPAPLQRLADRCRPAYAHLRKYRAAPADGA